MKRRPFVNGCKHRYRIYAVGDRCSIKIQSTSYIQKRNCKTSTRTKADRIANDEGRLDVAPQLHKFICCVPFFKMDGNCQNRKEVQIGKSYAIVLNKSFHCKLSLHKTLIDYVDRRTVIQKQFIVPYLDVGVIELLSFERSQVLYWEVVLYTWS